MDNEALALLERVAKTYSELQSLSAEIKVTSVDDRGFGHEKPPGWGWYVAPNKVRIEEGGAQGRDVLVDNGVTCLWYLSGANQFSRSDEPSPYARGGQFVPFGAMDEKMFLFHEIAERVVDARILPANALGELRCEVTYEPAAWIVAPRPPRPSSPTTFTIDPHTFLVAKAEVSSPIGETPFSAHYTLTFPRLWVNTPIADSTFHFDPPRDAVDLHGPRGRPGLGDRPTDGSLTIINDKGEWESYRSHEFQPDGAMLERTNAILNGIEVTFERRSKLSEDRREWHVVERVYSARGEHEHTFTIPVA